MNKTVSTTIKSVAVVAGALLVAIILNSFVIQAYEVDGSSMEPSLRSGDRLVIWKLKNSLAKAGIGGYNPARGQIVVLTHSEGPTKTSYIKRVIGLPGERVVVKDGKIMVYNKSFPEGFDPDAGTTYIKNLAATFGNIDQTIPDNSVFVVGDNRVEGGSLDSRSSLGVVGLSELDGELWRRIFPVNRIGRVN